MERLRERLLAAEKILTDAALEPMMVVASVFEYSESLSPLSCVVVVDPQNLPSHLDLLQEWRLKLALAVDVDAPLLVEHVGDHTACQIGGSRRALAAGIHERAEFDRLHLSDLQKEAGQDVCAAKLFSVGPTSGLLYLSRSAVGYEQGTLAVCLRRSRQLERDH